jgi:hypothetical protein
MTTAKGGGFLSSIKKQPETALNQYERRLLCQDRIGYLTGSRI